VRVVLTALVVKGAYWLAIVFDQSTSSASCATFFRARYGSQISRSGELSWREPVAPLVAQIFAAGQFMKCEMEQSLAGEAVAVREAARLAKPEMRGEVK
jgi:hypothetical protein